MFDFFMARMARPQAHQTHCEWAIGRLCAEMPGMAVHMRISKALVRGAASANTSAISSRRGWGLGAFHARESAETVAHWQRHYPWNFVTPMALNSRGEQIYYRVESDQDCMWAWRMDRAVDHHMAVRERDLGNLSDSHARDLRELKDGGLLRWRQQRIEALESRIVAMHKTFHNGRGLGL